MKGYSFPYDPEIHAAARGKEMAISPGTPAKSAAPSAGWSSSAHAATWGA